MDQLDCKLGQSLDPPACKSIFDVDVLPLDITEITQPLTEGVDFRRWSGRAVMQETDPRDFRRLLRMRRERPSRRRAAEQRDELAPLSFDHLVGEQLQRGGNGNSERRRSSEIDDQLELGGLIDRQVAGPLALEDPSGIATSAAICIGLNSVRSSSGRPPAQTRAPYSWSEWHGARTAAPAVDAAR